MSAGSSSESTSAEKLTLTDHLRARSRFFIEPIAGFMARIGLSPNALTVTGMLAHVFFGYLLAIGEFQWAAVVIFFIAPLDAFDGALARKLGVATGGFGAFWDSTLDRIAEILLFGGFLYYYAEQGDTIMMLVGYAAISGSLMVSYTRARAEGLGLTCKVGLFGRVERYAILMATLVLNLPQWTLIILAAGTFFTVGQRIWHVWQQTRDR